MTIKRLDLSWLSGTPIAHRGLHSNPEVPENSMLSFQKAVEAKYPIELDIRLTADKEIVVFHDADLLRVCCDNRLIKEITADKLKSMTLFDTEEGVPFLDDVLTLVGGQVPLLIELKVNNYTGELEDILFEKLKRYKGHVAVQSFHPLSVRHLKKLDSTLPCGMLSGSYECFHLDKFSSFTLKNLLMFPYVQPDFVSYEYSELLNISVSILRHFFSIPILAWTIDEMNKMNQVRNLCDNIIFEKIRI